MVAPAEMAAARGGATGGEVVERAALRREQTRAARLAIGGSRRTDDVGHLEHVPPLGYARPSIRCWIGSTAVCGHLGRQVRVEGGGLRARVPQIGLNQSQGHPRFEQMRGVRVAERVHVGALGHAGLEDRAMERRLQAGAGDWSGHRVRRDRRSPLGVRGEEPRGERCERQWSRSSVRVGAGSGT